MKRGIFKKANPKILKRPYLVLFNLIKNGYMYFFFWPILDCLIAIVVYSFLRHRQIFVIDNISIHLPVTVIILPTLSVALHEFAHIATAAKLKGTELVSGWIIFPLEHKMSVRFENEDVTDEEILQIFLSGPIFPLGFGMILLIIVIFIKPPKMVYLYPLSLIISSIITLLPNREKDRSDGKIIQITREKLGFSRKKVWLIAIRTWFSVLKTIFLKNFRKEGVLNE